MRRRTLLSVFALAIVLGMAVLVLYPIFDDARFLRPIDYMEYWSAGRALMNGENPYDGAILYPMQLEIQRQHPEPFGDPIMMWNPPWTLPIVMPLAVTHWRVGQFAWFTLNTIGFLLAAPLLWRIYGGPARLNWLALVLALAFAPAIFQLMLLNITGLIYLGLVGFLYCLAYRGSTNAWIGFAGILAALTAIKPHLFAPFAMVLALESLRGQRIWRAVVAGGCLLLVLSVLPLLWNSDVWQQYRVATAAERSETHYTTRDWVHPTIGYQIREMLPGRPFSGVFIPLAIGLPLVATYWWYRRENWNWVDELPRLLLVGLIITPYGAWGCDLVILTIPLIQATSLLTSRLTRTSWAIFAVGFATLNAFAYLRLQSAGSMGNPWITPATALGYLAISYLSRSSPLQTASITTQVHPRVRVSA